MIHLLSSRSFFELMLFFSKEEFGEEPLKDILDSFKVTETDPVLQSLVYDNEEQERRNQPEFTQLRNIVQVIQNTIRPH